MDARSIREKADHLRALHEEIHTTFRRRGESVDANKAWQLACTHFHEMYDELAFPGGLERGLAQLRAMETAAIETAVAFLEADPYFFRSGYVKAELLRRLKRAPLTKSQEQRLRDVVLARMCGPHRRELRGYCQLAVRIATPGFEADLRALATADDARTARHAGWALAALASRPARGT